MSSAISSIKLFELISCSKCQTPATADTKLQVCARCHFEKYCSANCQKKHWSTHKKICRPSLKPNVAWKALADKVEGWRGSDLEGPIPTDTLVKKVMPHINSISDYWDDFASIDALEIPNLLINHYSDRLTCPTSQSALDLGCSLGSSTLFLVKRGWCVKAIDYSAVATEKLKVSAQQLGITNNQLSVFTDKIDNYSFTHEDVDLVVANDIFPFYNPGQLKYLLCRIHTTLKENGVLIGTFFTHWEPQLTRFQIEAGAWHLDNDTSMEMANALIISSGFDCKILQARPNDPMLEFYAVKRN